MTIEDYCISLNPNNFFLVVLGVVDMCHDLLNIPGYFPEPIKSRKLGKLGLQGAICLGSKEQTNKQMSI